MLSVKLHVCYSRFMQYAALFPNLWAHVIGYRNVLVGSDSCVAGPVHMLGNNCP